MSARAAPRAARARAEGAARGSSYGARARAVYASHGTRTWALCAALAACGGEIDLSGVYRVDAYVASQPCGNDQPVAMPPAALKFVKGDLFGSDYFYYEQCTDQAGTDCAGAGLFGDSFAEPIDGGWRGVTTSAQGAGTTCTISFTDQTATLHDRLLVVEISTHAAQVENTSALCTPEEAERRNTDMPCTSHERFEATRQ